MLKAGGFKFVVLALVALAITAMLTGCGDNSGNAGSTPNSDAKQQFLAERGGTPGVMTNTFTYGGDGQGQQPPGAIGSVQSINSNAIVIKAPIDGTTSTVHVADGAKVHKQEQMAISDLKVGDKIAAYGQMDGDTLKAAMIQVGGSGTAKGSVGSGPVTFFDNGTGPDSKGASGSGDSSGNFSQQQSNSPPQSVSGTVDKVEGDKITVKSDDGSTSVVQPGDGARITRQAEGQIADIKVGDLISATGSQNGDAFEADEVTILGKAPSQ